MVKAKYLKKHYGHRVNGFWYPRVTSICGIISKPGLENWFASHGSVYAMKKRRKELTDWGNKIHETVESILLGRMPKIDSEICPSIDAFLEWMKNHQIDIKGIEQRVISKEHAYSGTLDVIAKIDNKFGVLDIKTSKNIWDNHFIQTAAYLEAYNENKKEKAETQWVLRIDQYQECKKCGAQKRKKGKKPSIKGGKKKCKHDWSDIKGVCEIKEAAKPSYFKKAFFNAKDLWEFSNREWLKQVRNYPKRLKYDKK